MGKNVKDKENKHLYIRTETRRVGALKTPFPKEN